MAWCSAIGLPKVLALLGVRDGQLEGADPDAAGPGRHVDPADLDAVHHLEEALARRAAEDVVGAA